MEGCARAPYLGLLLLLFIGSSVEQGRAYLGKKLGRLSELQHLVKGDVYAVDSRTLHIKDFSYDGTAPDAFFYVGTSGRPSDRGIIVPDENGSTKPLGPYRNKDVTLTLPDGMTLNDIAWISVWCRAFTVDFGNLIVPRNFGYPRPQKIDALPTLEHGVSSDRIVIVDAQTFLIPNFYYDGTAPDAHFWVGSGRKPDPKGTKVPDENGSTKPLKKYTGKTIVITLPGDMTVFDIDYLSIWCEAFYADFGHVLIPKNLNVPPSLKMLGVAPQTKLNCEVLWDDLAFEVRWAVAGQSIVMQLVGKVADNDYMAFGLSGSDSRSVMTGGDVVVAWLDQTTGRGEAVDYYLESKSQCQGGRGSCPDRKIQNGRNDVRLLNAALINNFSMLTFQRPLTTSDPTDRPILTNTTQAVIWAIGNINSQGDTAYHHLRQRGNVFIEFGRSPLWNCPLPDGQNKKSSKESPRPTPAPARPIANPWVIPPIPCYEPEDGVFYAQIGPTGGPRGYDAITGHVGWGIAWYINGLLIPEIYVVRGKTYTFVVEGGSDPSNTAKYHPFYITDDPEGGMEFKTPAERARTRVFAGVNQARDGTLFPSSTGRLCEWKEKQGSDSANPAQSFGAYQRSLQLDCLEGQPGILQWTPDADTPDTVYYQCFTHRFLGWKINVLDRCDEGPGQVTRGGSRGSTRTDYDYYNYDDYVDFGTSSDDVTLGGSTRYESLINFEDVAEEIPNLANNFNPDDLSLGFDSFPFDLDLKKSDHIARQNHDLETKEVPLGDPEFQFPRLPPLKKPESRLQATSILNFQKFGLREKPKKSVSTKPTLRQQDPEFLDPRRRVTPKPSRATLFRYTKKPPEFSEEITAPTSFQKSSSPFLRPRDRGAKPKYHESNRESTVVFAEPVDPSDYPHSNRKIIESIKPRPVPIEEFGDFSGLDRNPNHRYTENERDMSNHRSSIDSHRPKVPSSTSQIQKGTLIFANNKKTDLPRKNSPPSKIFGVDSRDQQFEDTHEQKQRVPPKARYEQTNPHEVRPEQKNPNHRQISAYEVRHEEINAHQAREEHRIPVHIKDKPTNLDKISHGNRNNEQRNTPNQRQEHRNSPNLRLEYVNRPDLRHEHLNPPNLRQEQPNSYEVSHGQGIPHGISPVESYQEVDPNTGLPFAINKGFDPSTIVLENDFKPVHSTSNIIGLEPTHEDLINLQQRAHHEVPPEVESNSNVSPLQRPHNTRPNAHEAAPIKINEINRRNFNLPRSPLTAFDMMRPPRSGPRYEGRHVFTKRSLPDVSEHSGQEDPTSTQLKQQSNLLYVLANAPREVTERGPISELSKREQFVPILSSKGFLKKRNRMKGKIYQEFSSQNLKKKSNSFSHQDNFLSLMGEEVKKATKRTYLTILKDIWKNLTEDRIHSPR